MNNSFFSTNRFIIVIIVVILVGLATVGTVVYLSSQNKTDTSSQRTNDQELQSATDDTARKTDANQIYATISTFSDENRGRQPTIDELNSSEHLNKLSIIRSVVNSGEPTTTQALYSVGTTCDGQKASSRAFTVSVLLSTGKSYCIDN